MSVLLVQIKVRLSWINHELGADNGSGTVHTWPEVGFEPLMILFSLRGQFLNVTLLILNSEDV